MKIFLIAILIAVVSLSASEGDSLLSTSPWKKEGAAMLNLSQSRFDNWAGGGENAFAWQLNVNALAKRSIRKNNIELGAKLQYGETQSGDADAQKNSDELRLDALYIYNLEKFADPYASFLLRSQTMPGYQYSDSSRVKVSAFLDPGYMMQSLGLGLAPTENLRFRAGLSLKETLADDFAAVYSDDSETTKIEKLMIEPGLEWIIDYNQSFLKMINVSSKAEFFSDLSIAAAIDVNWDSKISAQIGKYLAVNFNVRLLYDSDQSAVRQLQEMLALGLTYTIF
ncbi:MAG TPA: DUF3078 domain-containing protein [Candidatus Marinimicrobia bacterium]|nr:DUF3078 domain-containing protein [Candidatus Neomarinimicrobiota bacterium]